MTNDPDILVDLATAASEFEAEAMKSELAARGIEAKVFAVADATLRPFTQQAIRVAVRRADLESAIAIVREFQEQPPVSDWSAVDTGDTAPLTDAEIASTERLCASCQYPLSPKDAAACPRCGVSFLKRPPRWVSGDTDSGWPSWVTRLLAAAAIALLLALALLKFGSRSL
jgi:hypothetical protein